MEQQNEKALEFTQVRRLDDPMKLFWFTQGQTAAFFLLFIVGGMANAVMSGILAGAALAYLIGAESRTHRAFWRHIAYWYIPGRLGLRCMPESGSRQFLK
jgi:type IV conjugative transfer system protein TraL